MVKLKREEWQINVVGKTGTSADADIAFGVTDDDKPALRLGSYIITGEESRHGGTFIGYVSENGAFPTTRPDGSALDNEDFVRPDPEANFPFEIDGIVFPNRLTEAVWFNGKWHLNPGVIQDTSETPIKNIATESLNGDCDTQQEVNVLNAEILRELSQINLQPKLNISLPNNKLVNKKGESVTFTPQIELIKTKYPINKLEITVNGELEATYTRETSPWHLTGDTQTIFGWWTIGATSDMILGARVIDEIGLQYEEYITIKFVKPCLYNKFGTDLYYESLSENGEAVCVFNFIDDPHSIDPIGFPEPAEPVLSASPIIKVPKELVSGRSGTNAVIGGFTKRSMFTEYAVNETYTIEEDLEYLILKWNTPCGLRNYMLKPIFEED